MNIGNWIKQSRTSAGLTQAELGDFLGKTKANISSWENNLHYPSYEQMLKIAEATKWKIPLPGLQTYNSNFYWPFRNIETNDVSLLSKEDIEDIEALIQIKLQRIKSLKTEPNDVLKIFTHLSNKHQKALFDLLKSITNQ